jgi:glycogen synthase
MKTDKKTRVLILTFEYGPIRCGGLGTMVTSLCGAMDKERFEPVVVLPKSGRTLPWPLVKIVQLPRCEAEVYRHDGCEVWLLANPILNDADIYPEEGIEKFNEYGERVADALPHLNAQVIHLHDVFGYKCLPAAARLGAATIFTVHRLSYVDGPSAVAAEALALQTAGAVTTVSRSYRDENLAWFGGRPDTRVIPNGIDAGFFRFHGAESVTRGRHARARRLLDQFGFPDGATCAFLGRLDRAQKGIDVLLDAYDDHLAGRRINLLIVGEGDKELTRRIEAAAGRSGRRLRFVNQFSSSEAVREILAAVDFALIPSRFEPFGLIQLEAMAMGAIPIASRTGGLKDVIIDVGLPGGFGRLFENGDADALGAAVLEMTALKRRHPASIDRLREAGAAKVREYSCDAMARRYEELYTQMSAKVAAGRAA